MAMDDGSHDRTRDYMREQFARMLKLAAKTNMPFGRYGPSAKHPQGVPIVRLPLEYLLWMERKGFPRGTLGEVMQWVCEIKSAGCGDLLDAGVRAVRGQPKK